MTRTDQAAAGAIGAAAPRTAAAVAEHSAQEGHCITCADAGAVMTVLQLDGASALCVDEEAVEQRVAIELVAPVAVGDQLLVHAGVAISALGRPA